jgi:hypothetical protein
MTRFGELKTTNDSHITVVDDYHGRYWTSNPEYHMQPATDEGVLALKP